MDQNHTPDPDRSSSDQSSEDRLRARAVRPASLSGHEVPTERLDPMVPNLEALAQTALAVSGRLPLQADMGDMFAVMNRDADAAEARRTKERSA